MQSLVGIAAELSSAAGQTAVSTDASIPEVFTTALPPSSSTATEGSTAAPDHQSTAETHAISTAVASNIANTLTEPAQSSAVQSMLNRSAPDMQLAGHAENAPGQTSANTEASSVQADVESSPTEDAHQRLASQPSHNMDCITAEQPLLPQSSFSTSPSTTGQQPSQQAISSADPPEPLQESVPQLPLSEESSTNSHIASADADATLRLAPAATDMTDAAMRPAASVTEDPVPQTGSIISHTLHEPSVCKTSSQVATDTLHAAQLAGISCAPNGASGLVESIEAAATEATQSSSERAVLESASRLSRIHSSAALDLDVSEQGQASSSATGPTAGAAAVASETGALGLSNSQQSLQSLTDDAHITPASRDNGSSHVPDLLPAYIPAPPQHSSTRSPAPRKGSFRHSPAPREGSFRHSMPVPSGRAGSLPRANSSQARNSDPDMGQDPGSPGVPGDSSLLVGQDQSQAQQGGVWQTQESGQCRHAVTPVGAWPKLAEDKDLLSVQVCALLLWSPGLAWSQVKAKLHTL